MFRGLHSRTSDRVSANKLATPHKFGSCHGTLSNENAIREQALLSFLNPDPNWLLIVLEAESEESISGAGGLRETAQGFAFAFAMSDGRLQCEHGLSCTGT